MFKVLIVEDDPMVAMIHRQFLTRDSRFEVVGTCGDGVTALKFIEANAVDLVILDVHMPHVGGLGLLHSLRDRNYPVGVVMVTAANDVATVEEAFRLGAVDYLVKPFSYDRLQTALDKFAAQRGALAGATALDQENIDRYLEGARQPSSAPASPKGIQDKTVEVLVDFLRETDQKWLTGDEIADGVKLSSVTVRRYLNHLVRQNVAEGRMDYETGGRPRLLYRLKRAE